MSSSKKKLDNPIRRNAALQSLTSRLSVSQGRQASISGHNHERSSQSKQVPSAVSGCSRRTEECTEANRMANSPRNRSTFGTLNRESQIIKLDSAEASHNSKKTIVVNAAPSILKKAVGSDPSPSHEAVSSRRKKKRTKSNQSNTVQADDKPSPRLSESTDFPTPIGKVQAIKSPCSNARHDVFSGLKITTRSVPTKHNPFGPNKGASASGSSKTITTSNSVKQRSAPNTPDDSVLACLRVYESLRKRRLNGHPKKAVPANVPNVGIKKDLSQPELINRYNRAHPSKVRDVEGAPSYNTLELDHRVDNERVRSQSYDGLRRVKSLQSCAVNDRRIKINISATGHGNHNPCSVLAAGSRSATRMPLPPDLYSESSYPTSGWDTNSKTGMLSVKLDLKDDDCLDDSRMEWEDIEDEKVLQNIKVLRECCQNNEDQLIEDMDTNCFDISQDSGTDCVIVLDTNILISHLKYVKELSQREYEALGRPILVIPWMVLRELDTLKGGLRGTKSRNPALESKARSASHFINSCFSSHHPRVKGQSALEDREHCIEIDVPDDSILNCCLHLQRKGKKVILLSNDVNFCNKAMATGISSFGKDQLNKALALGSIVCGGGEHSPQSETDIKLHQMYTKCEALLEEFLSKFIETEMKRVFKNWWTKVIFMKPPWSLLDSLQNLSKHWIAVFSFIMDKSGFRVVEDLLAVLTKGEPSEAEKVVRLAVSLCRTMKSDYYQAMAAEYEKSFMKFRRKVQAILIDHQ
ncbi:uncharacterized protein LOC124157223 isoform X2 [Ischnura elegans]|uniref:uncharacterized protein LOC124157223 isoform X2 n=1 Tax=Ischnura elegans TaxID=197161 RepID=UPI001ED88C04|nr:uncharacterized protein LOC124157223 isoform X2 [Ischnura elegans]